MRTLPTAPFRVLDAPSLKDDFYCSVLAYSETSHSMAVALGNSVYSWSEIAGANLLNSTESATPVWITSVAFSSAEGGKCILATGRSNGSLILLSLHDQAMPRFELQHARAISCVSWRPTTILRPSLNPSSFGKLILIEELVVGDELGNIYCYVVEWPNYWETTEYQWTGAINLASKISIHSQQICGLAWSSDGKVFATGGNDNLCLLFETARVFGDIDIKKFELKTNNESRGIPPRTQDPAINGEAHFFGEGDEVQRWIHGAAVKAIAFCPWREGLVATGGGSNDKCIHFFHTITGSCLATISVAAQVTSLIWSTSHREIAATFGYAQPDHPYRVAVFSWPDCRQVAAIPWEGEHRALYAIAYPGRSISGPRYKKDDMAEREGCIVIAASDECIKFHEVWGRGERKIGGGQGLLGGSDILEGLEGIDKEGDIIR